ncbi:acyltransferase family protein [Robiginitalea marina]|uniref:DUF1624 domain-containing protein n=1 Tax=Robiginitalea marina TaxID=2954105 RepID=A0ABT1AU14_9FLAO|nr:acyltransferase family protein [Robiginitalea marina]MCO5723422.1 DUF1624 domain-containing protein [Robiginitalea marina]
MHNMGTREKRLFFIDAMRAWAILMMLQGHFIDALLDPVFSDPANGAFALWSYFRGITAPVFFTVSGFIFTYLLLGSPNQGLDNPRIRKGIKRGLQLILIGYLLRTNLFGLFKGEFYPTSYQVDVLHCIGISLLFIVGVYALTKARGYRGMGGLLLGFGVLLFLFEPLYKSWDYSMLPLPLANYFTRANGSVFTIFPWVGYAFIGGFLSMAFRALREDRYRYLKSIGASLAAGALLVWASSPVFIWAGSLSGIPLFDQVASNNYLFIRLGNVFVVFAVFMALRGLLQREVFLKIGQNTLAIYVIHFMVLYGSLLGIGLYRFLHHSLSPSSAIPGALAFMAISTMLALWYDRNEGLIKAKATGVALLLKTTGEQALLQAFRLVRVQVLRLLRFLKGAQERI